MFRVSAAVINWNNREQIVACLDSLINQVGITLDPIVLDNGSTDGSTDLIRRQFPQLRIIENGRNIGFAAAHNIGYRETSGEWHLVLNSDVVLERNYVKEILKAIGEDRAAAAGSGKLLRFERTGGTDIIDSAGIEMFASRRVWDRGTSEPDRGQFDEMQRVFGCCGAAALYRREALLQVAPNGEIFPEIYFAYYEDVDLAWVLNVNGWKSMHVPSAVGRHMRGGSTKGSVITRKLVFRNRYLLLARNDRCGELWRSVGSVAQFEAFQLLRLIRHPRLLAELPATWRAIRQALRERRQMLVNGRRRFGLSGLEQLVSPGAGLSGWLLHSRSAARAFGTPRTTEGTR